PAAPQRPLLRVPGLHRAAGAGFGDTEVPGVAGCGHEDQLGRFDLKAAQQLALDLDDCGALFALALRLSPGLADHDRSLGDVARQAHAHRRQAAGELVGVDGELALWPLLPLVQVVEHGSAADDDAGGEQGGKALAATRLTGAVRRGHQATSRIFPNQRCAGGRSGSGYMVTSTSIRSPSLRTMWQRP